MDTKEIVPCAHADIALLATEEWPNAARQCGVDVVYIKPHVALDGRLYWQDRPRAGFAPDHNQEGSFSCSRAIATLADALESRGLVIDRDAPVAPGHTSKIRILGRRVEGQATAPLAKKQIDQKWHLEYHIDDDYRLTDSAANAWLGLICDEGADEVIDLGHLAVQDWAKTYALAQHIVEHHNASLE